MNEGWVSVSRKILDSSVWLGERFTKGQAWIDILLSANYTDNEVLIDYKPVKVLRGQFLTSQVKLAKRWKWDRLSVKRFLSVLEVKQTIHMATHRAFEHGFTIITIQNYDRYQPNTTGQPATQPTGQPQGNHRATRMTNKENKENKENKILHKNVVLTPFGNPDINECQRYFLEVMKLPTEDGSPKWNRIYWSNMMKEGGRGIDGVKALIDLASGDDWFKNNITSAKDLWRNRVKLIARKRGDIPKVAVMPKEVSV